MFLFQTTGNRSSTVKFIACSGLCLNPQGSSPPAVDGLVFMSFVIPLRFGHWSRLQLVGNESDITCWHWLPIWVTSISTLPTGTWKPRLSFCATSLSSPRTLCREDSHDSSRTAHRSFLP